MSHKLEMLRLGVVGTKDDTGIGRQCHNMKAILGVPFQLVSPSRRLIGHNLNETTDCLLLQDATHNEVTKLLEPLDGIIVIERNKWNPCLFEIAKEMRKYLFLIPNWEWFDKSDPAYSLVDHFIVHSEHSRKFLISCGYNNVTKLQAPVDLNLLPLRSIQSAASVFLHNAGIIDINDRKGTHLVLAAWKKKKRSSSRLIVRYQKSELPEPMGESSNNIFVQKVCYPSPWDLYAIGQCAIQPSRLEGLGYMVLEPLLCGIPTITTDAPPMNEWQLGTILCTARQSAESALPSTRGIEHARLADADTSELASLIENAEQTNLSHFSRLARELRTKFDPKYVREQWVSFLRQF